MTKNTHLNTSIFWKSGVKWFFQRPYYSASCRAWNSPHGKQYQGLYVVRKHRLCYERCFVFFCFFCALFHETTSISWKSCLKWFVQRPYYSASCRAWNSPHGKKYQGLYVVRNIVYAMKGVSCFSFFFCFFINVFY